MIDPVVNVRAQLQTERDSRKRHRYQREEVTLQRTRVALELGDREAWLQDTLETERILG